MRTILVTALTVALLVAAGVDVDPYRFERAVDSARSVGIVQPSQVIHVQRPRGATGADATRFDSLAGAAES